VTRGLSRTRNALCTGTGRLLYPFVAVLRDAQDFCSQDAHVGQLTVPLAIIQAITHDETVRQAKATVANGDRNDPVLGALKQGTDGYTRRLPHAEILQDIAQR